MECRAFDGLRAPVVVLDRDGVVTHWNDVAVSTTGLRASDVVGAPFVDLLATDDVAHAARVLRATGEASEPLTEAFVARLSTKRGELLSTEWTAFAIEQASERAVLLIGAARRAPAPDPLDRAAFVQLSQLDEGLSSDAPLLASFEAIASAAKAVLGAERAVVQLYDEATGERRVVAIRGFSDSEVEAVSTITEGPMICVESLHQRERIVVDDLASSPRFECSQSQEVFVAMGVRSAQATPIVARDGRLLGVCSTFRSAVGPHDPRALAWLDLILREARCFIEHREREHALERAVQSREEVLGYVAHDLKSPLNGMLLELELLSHKPELGDDGREALDRLVRAALRMNRLVEDMLDVARLEGGSFGIERGPIDIAELIADGIDALNGQAARAEVELVRELDPLPKIMADRDRLLSVVDNLVGNAIKFSSPGKRVFVSARLRGREIVVGVADEGVGIERADVPHLFDRFWQANRGDRRGAGLGLAISKGIVDAHGGRIWAESREGVGTRFCFTLPISRSSHASVGVRAR